MALFKLKPAVLILVLLIIGCTKKDELTKPVRIHLNFCIAPPEESSRADYFYFDGAHIGINNIEFTGKREIGDDVFFETGSNASVQSMEFNEVPELLVDLDLPQGIYDLMTWDVYLKEMSTTGLTGFNSPGTGMVIRAIYEYIDESIIQLFLCIDESEIFRFKSYGPDLSSVIALSENKSFNVTLQFDLYSAFWPVSRESIENAEKSIDLNGKPIIVISSSKNKSLYQNLLFRISLSARALVY